MWGRHISKSSMAKYLFEKASLLNSDLCSVSKRHSGKQQNLGYFSHKEKSTSLLLLKIHFYVLSYVNFDISQQQQKIVSGLRPDR